MTDITLSMITFFGKIKIVFPQPFDVYAKQQFLLTFLMEKQLKFAKARLPLQQLPLQNFLPRMKNFKDILTVSRIYSVEKSF